MSEWVSEWVNKQSKGDYGILLRENFDLYLQIYLFILLLHRKYIYLLIFLNIFISFLYFKKYLLY